MKYKDGNTWKEITIKALDSMPLGMGVEFFGPKNKIPTGFLVRDGSAISRTEYADLFNIIGTTYGQGDGSTTFNLPNDCGRVTVGIDENDTDFDTLGETGGEKKHTLTIDEMPKHSHKVYYTDDGGQGGIARINIMGNQTPTTEVGGNQPHNNMQPYIAVWKCIKAKNTTPTMASIVDAYSTSTQDGYSANYVNNQINNLKAYSLYDNNSGSTGEITLSDSCANYSYIEILFMQNQNIYNSVKVYNPNNKEVSLMAIAPDVSNSVIWLQTRVVKPSGNKISTVANKYGQIALASGSGNAYSGQNFIYITKVIGYK